jgi:ABC-type Fe3+ transport system substrate-binding protein
VHDALRAARANGVAVPRSAPNALGAVLFYDYELIEEGQKILASRDFVATHSKIANPFSKTGIRLVDSQKMLDEYDKWTKVYGEIFGGGKA